MEHDVLAYLHNALEAAKSAKRFLAGHTFDSYVSDELLRSAVERKFEIVGEALNRIYKVAPQVLGRVREYRDVISFRNILAHGYDAVDHQIV